MSFDLEIVTNKRPLRRHVEEFFSSRKGFIVNGTLDIEAGNVLITTKTRNNDHPCFTIDGPFRIEIDDLENIVSASVLDPNWLTQISVPSGASEVDLKIAKEVASYIADTSRGSVYDPQANKVIWPRRSQRRYVAPVKKERIRLIGLDWFLPIRQSSGETARVLLHLLQKKCPEGLPTRFGAFEPLQQRFDPTDAEPFIRMWEEVSRVEFGDSFFWKSKSPCYGGHVSFPDQRDQYKPERAGRSIHLSMDFDGRALHADTAWCETVVGLFVELARKLHAFYAMGYVQRNMIAGRSIWSDGRSEPSPTLPGRWWLGIPPKPAWLVWFGGAYARELQAALAAPASTITDEGILLRQGPAPMDADELEQVFPVLPDILIAQRDGEQYQPAREIPVLE